MFWLKSRSSPTGTPRDLDTVAPCAPWWRSPGCSAQPLTTTGPRFQQGQEAEQHAAAAHEVDRAPNVVGSGKAAIAQRPPLSQHSAVRVRAAEPHAEGTRESGLGHARVRALGERAIAIGDAER